MADEILIKVRADLDGFSADMQEAKKIGNSAIAEIEKNTIDLKINNASELTATLKAIAKEGGAAFSGLENGVEAVVNDTAKLKQFIGELTKSLQGMQKGSQEFNVLNEIIRASNVQLNNLNSTTIKTGESLRTQMRKAQQEVAELSAKFGATSTQAIEAAKRAAELKDTIGDAKALTDAFNPDAKFKALTSSIQGVASGFSAVQGAMGLFGAEGKKVEEMLLKVNSAMALSQGLQGLGESFDSFKQLGAVIKTQVVGAFTTLRGAIAATGLGLLAIALGVIVANWEELVGWIENTFPAMKKVTEFFRNFQQNASGVLNSVVVGFKTLGDVIGKIFKGDFSGAYNSAKNIGSNMSKAFREGYDKKDTELKNAELTKEKKHHEKKVKIAVDASKDISKELAKQQEEIRQKELSESQKLYDEIEKLKLDPYEREKQKINDEYFYKIEKAKKFGLDFKALENERDRQIQEVDNKRIESENKLTETAKKNADSVGTALGDAYKRGYQTAEEYQAELLAKQKQAVNELLDFAQNGILLQIGLNPQDVSNLRASLETLNEQLKDGLQPKDWGAIAQTAQAAYQSVSNAIFSADTQRRQEEIEQLNAQKEEELRLAGDNEQKKDIIRQKYALKEREIKRKQAEADKRKAIMDATINTAVAVIKAISQSPLTLGMPWAAIVAALGAAQIALIAATPIPKFAKGGAVPSSDIQGMIDGKPHAAGGVLIEAEGNEFITRKSQAMKSDNLGLLEAINMSDKDRDAYINRHYIIPALQAKESKAKEIYRHSQIEAENNLIARVSSHTLKSIHKEQKNTTNAIKRLDKKDFKW